MKSCDRLTDVNVVIQSDRNSVVTNNNDDNDDEENETNSNGAQKDSLIERAEFALYSNTAR